MTRLPGLAACIIGAFIACLAGCLKDHPLLLPENAYDPSLALRSDSLSRFDSVEIVLVDLADSTRVLPVFRGRPGDAGDLAPRAAGDGRTLIYVVRGWHGGGLCFTQRLSKEGRIEATLDSCDAGPGPADPDPRGGDTAGPAAGRPHFLVDTLDFGATSAMLPLSVAGLSGHPGLRIEREPGPDGPAWARPGPISTFAEDSQTVACGVQRAGLAPGDYAGLLVLRGDSAAFDSLWVRMSVPELPGAALAGRLLAAFDSAPEPAWTVELLGGSGGGEIRITGADGGFDFGRRPPGDYRLRATAPGRVGKVFAVRVEDGGAPAPGSLLVLPASGFRQAPLAWNRSIGAVTVAAGHALAPSSEFETPGQVAVFPLDNLSPSLQRYLAEGNEGETAGEYLEAGDAAADSHAVYLAYPESDRLGRIGAWRSAPSATSAMNAAAGMQPSDLLIEGGRLLALGRNREGTLALGTYDAASLSLLRMDTLSGHAWDGSLALQRGPRLASHRDAWYAVDGNGPAVKGRLLRIDKAAGRVTAWLELPEAQACDVAVHGDEVWVAFAGGAGSLRAYSLDLVPAASGAIDVGGPAHRIAFADSGALEGYAMALIGEAGGSSLAFVDIGSRKAVGRLSLPGSIQPRALAVDAASGRILAADGKQVFMAGF